MKTRNLLIALASASLVAAGPALAQGRGGGHGGGQGGGHGAGMGGGVGGSMSGGIGRGGMSGGISADIDDRINTRANARANSQGPANASPTGIANANENSVLFGATIPDLTGLAIDSVILNSAGETVGTVSRITRSGDRIRNVFVTLSDGSVVRLRSGTISLDGTTFVTTDTRFND